jgi:hypothetical protein
VTNYIKHVAVRIAVAATVVSVGGCNFLTGGEASNDPNRQVVATNDQYFVATQENLWGYWGSDLARVTGILAQQFHGVANQYGALESRYSHDETPPTDRTPRFTLRVPSWTSRSCRPAQESWVIRCTLESRRWKRVR